MDQLPSDCVLHIVLQFVKEVQSGFIDVASYIRFLKTNVRLSRILRDPNVQRFIFKVPPLQDVKKYIKSKYFFDFVFSHSKHFKGGNPKIYAGKCPMHPSPTRFNSFTIYGKRQTDFPEKNQILFNLGLAQDPLAKSYKLIDINRKYLIGLCPYQKNVGILINYEQDLQTFEHFYRCEIWNNGSLVHEPILFPIETPEQIIITVYCESNGICFEFNGHRFPTNRESTLYPCYKTFKGFEIEKMSLN